MSTDGVDHHRDWVVWGDGPYPPMELGQGSRPANDIAELIAAGRDPGWHEDEERWVAIVNGDENLVDGLMLDVASVRGYAPYLVPGADAELDERDVMEPTLRDDVAPRRKVDQPRPA